jgi:hypothetical protein
MGEPLNQPGLIALMGSGETSAAGGQIFEAVAAQLDRPLTISLLETPAGFELNASRVAARVGDFIKTRLQNYDPSIRLIAARKRGTAFSPDSKTVLADLLDSQMIFMGPGSPTYAIRQLQGSLAWQYVRTLHRLGAAVVMASAATISLGSAALPVYEIYKVGQDPFWSSGLDFFKPYGLSIVMIPHWNNSEGGSEVDTSRCFIGRERFDPLCAQLPADTTVVGLDEHTGILIDLARQIGTVMGRGQVHILSTCREQAFGEGEEFPLSALGPFRQLTDPMEGIDPQVWQEVAEGRQSKLDALHAPPAVPGDVQQLVAQRQEARARKNWAESDRLRAEISELGWKVLDTPEGPQLERS